MVQSSKATTGLARLFGSFATFTIVLSTATNKKQLLLKDKHGDWTGRRRANTLPSNNTNQYVPKRRGLRKDGSYRQVGISHLCCSAHIFFIFFCRICAQIDNWNHLYLWIFLWSVCPSSELFHCKGDMGSLVHSRECGEATAVSVTFHPDLVAEIWNVDPGAWICRFLYSRQVYFLLL